MTESIKTWQRFAQVLIETNELDPTYPLIKNLHETMDKWWFSRFMIYFMLFYDLGGAIKCADNTRSANFWDYVTDASNNPQTKRGSARRHFRGLNASRAIAVLRGFDLYELVEDWHAPTYTELYRKMTTKYARSQMGPYFIWKLYDLQNICLDRPISLSLDEAVKFMPEEPRQNAAMAFPKASFRQVLTVMTAEVAELPHPVREGYCGLAEVETILCAFKGYFGTKSHWVGQDIAQRHEELLRIGLLGRTFSLPNEIERNAYSCDDIGPL